MLELIDYFLKWEFRRDALGEGCNFVEVAVCAEGFPQSHAAAEAPAFCSVLFLQHETSLGAACASRSLATGSPLPSSSFVKVAVSSVTTLVTKNIMEKRGEMSIGCSGRLAKGVFFYPNIKKHSGKKACDQLFHAG